MKNIHLIETKIGQRITKTNKGEFLWCSTGDDNFVEVRRGYLGFHLYITSSEEIKEGDLKEGEYYLYFNKIRQFKEIDNLNRAWKDYKKIILTTDPDLIKDGVQTIDNEFLQWFVENPSYEKVEVKSKEYDYRYGVKQTLVYKIVIPNLEAWKDIPDFEGYYQVSNFGNVKSLSRIILGKNNTPTLLKEKLLKFSISTKGYYQVILNKNSNRKIFKVHSLVAICFLNHTPDGTHKVVVDHINEIKTDNRVENLRLIGHRENVSRSIKDSTSTYVGVSWSKNAKKWISQITIEGKTKYLGLFDNEKDANKKYLETLKDL